MASHRKTSPLSPYRGINTSLYASLSDDIIQHIERAIWLKTIGQTNVARALFDNELQHLRSVPLVIIERADLELEAGQWGQAWRVLDSQVNNLRLTDPDLELPEHRLVMLTRAMLGVRHRGDLISAAHEIERTQQWLRDTAVSDYTDVQTSCIRRYVIVYLLTKLSSKYENPTAEHIPANDPKSHPTEAPVPWSGLHDLRRSLTARGMIHEANAFFRVELNRTPPANRELILEEFLLAIQGLPSDHGRDLIETSIRVQWANTHYQLGNLQRALQETVNSETAFSRWCTEFKIEDLRSAPIFHAMICERLNVFDDASVENRIEKLGAIEKAISIMESADSSKTGSCLSNAADTALSLFQDTGDDKYLTKYYDLHARLEIFDETVSEDLCDLVRHRCSLIGFTVHSMTDRQKSLEWIEAFLEHHPYFSAPGELEILHSQRVSLLRHLRRLPEAMKAQELADKFNNAGPSLGKDLHLSVRNEIAPMGVESNATEDNSEDEFFLSSWGGVMGDDKKTANAVIDRLMDWSFEDVLSGHITAQSFEKITSIPSSDFKVDATVGDEEHMRRLKEEKRDDIWSLIFPPNAESERANEDRREHIMGWLNAAPKGQRNKRLFCLLNVRDSRQYHFSALHQRDFRIVELQQLLDFYEQLPNPIRAVCRSHKNSWLSDLAFTYFAKLEGNLGHPDPAVQKLLEKAEHYCERSVEEHRKLYHPGQLALQQRLGADICIFKIRLLQHQLKQMSVVFEDVLQNLRLDEAATDAYVGSDTATSLLQQIADIRSTGMTKIKETEQIYTGNELHALWFEGLNTSEQERSLTDLDKLEQRQRIAAFEGSFRTIQIAINLLLTGPISDEIIIETWRWVQKYKARSLAKTIGMRSPVQTLLDEILASDEARPIFEKFRDLQEQIKTVKTSARFSLRRQLDAHCNEMRRNPLLQRLIDLREGVPLDLTEIAAIQAVAGKDIVLVDWFYLEPYHTTAEGKLLMFTARSNSVVTMDVLAVTIDDVNAWGNEYLDPPMLKRKEAQIEINRLLGGLVAHLVERTKENEVLVFCPTNTLYRLPLHALCVEVLDPKKKKLVQEPILLRNPIVYIHSHSLLRTCHSTAENARHSPKSINPIFLSGISAFDASPGLEDGRECILDLADIFHTSPMIDATASKSEFMKVVTNSRLLHLHTHCNWNSEDPLDHHVEFPRRSTADPITPAATDRKLTAKDMFAIDLLPGTHVNLIACQGGLADVRPGDEVRGLVPALLYSGATSTVSTLWNIDDRDGADFSDVFFQLFLRQCRTPRIERSQAVEGETPGMQTSEGGALSTRFVDLAVAFQQAVSNLNPYEKALYHWAGFVLHGFWQFPVLDREIERFQQKTKP